MLWLNSRAQGECFTTQLCWETAGFAVTCLSLINQGNGLLLVRSRWCAEHELLRS